jgi:DNA (cytosine-5)-methyltransferase 1
VTPSKKKFKFYEFFAGAGMARLGLKHLWKAVWANDNNPKKVAIYEHNFGKGHIDPRDVALVAGDIESGRLLGTSNTPTFPLDADMAWASFPCQDLSLAGWQRGMSAERSGAYWPFWKIMYALEKSGHRPPVIVIENVRGLLYGDNFRGLCESLAALGMRFGAFLADSKSFVPQSRPRVFVVAVDDHVNLTGLTSQNVPSNPWFPTAVCEAFSELPDELKKKWVWWNVAPVTKERPCISSIFEENPRDVTYDTQKQTARLRALMTPRHAEKVDKALANPDVQVGFLYKRTRQGQQRAEVRFDGMAGCLRTPKGGSSRQTIVVVNNGTVRTRLLSRIEAARLMGIPLDEEGCLPGKKKKFFPGNFSYNDAYLAMGDGVVVPVVHYIATTILDELATRSHLSREKKRKGKALRVEEGIRNQFLERVDKHIAAWSDSAK